MATTPVHCTIDLQAPGKHVGRLELPRSNNTSGWSHLFVPIVSIAGTSEGPTALVIGGVHGDEPEGQIAALRLARETEPDDVTGRLLVVPAGVGRVLKVVIPGTRESAFVSFMQDKWQVSENLSFVLGLRHE